MSKPSRKNGEPSVRGGKTNARRGAGPWFWALFVVAAATVVVGLVQRRGDRTPTEKRTASTEPGLEATALRIVAKIRAQEAAKDATCWTTVRLMEGHQVSLPLDEFAVVAKIEVSKLFVYRLWRRASVVAGSSGVPLTARQLDVLVPGEVRPVIATLAEPTPGGGLPAAGIETAVKDYHRVTENLRVLLSLLYDEALGGGLFATVGSDLAPLDDSAIDRLAQISTGLTVLLLQEARREAEAEHHVEIGAADVQRAFRGLAARLGLDDAASADLPPPPPQRSPDGGAKARLQALTQTYAINKVQSLRAWNGPIWQSQVQGGDKSIELAAFSELLGRLAEVPITPAGTERFLLELAVFGDLVLSGYQPLRTDTFESSLDALRRQRAAGREDGRAPYLTVAAAANALSILFPHETLPNGDVHFVMVKNREPRRFRLLGPSADAMRDVTVHWYVLGKLLAKPATLPLEPFAAELVAERLSEMGLHLLLEAARLAKENGQGEIRPETFERLSWKYPAAYIIADPEKEKGAWTEKDEAQKAALLAGMRGPLFADVTLSSGLARRSCTKPPPGAPEPPFVAIQQYMGSGVAVGDYDGDGLPDLFLAADACNRLYRNLGSHTFRDVTAEAGLHGLTLDSRHAVFADVDGDARLDLLVVNSESGSRLFRQVAPGKFADVTELSRLTPGTGAHTAVFFDPDLDGDLDLFIGTYGAARPEDKGGPSIDGRNGHANELWRNDGKGRFKEVGAEVGLASTAWTLAALAYDVDGDGDLDLHLANDFGRDQLFRNDGRGRFEDVAEAWGADDRGSGMNVSVADVDGDGRFDAYVSMVDMFSKSIGFVLPVASSITKLDERIVGSTFYISGNKLYLNEGSRFRAAEHRLFEPGDRGWTWSSNFFDLENDGDEDLYIANGWSERTANWYQSNQLYVREGERFYLYPGASKRWEDPQGADRSVHRGLLGVKVYSAESYLGSSRAVAAVDLTGTGRMDLVVMDYHDPPRVLRNLSRNPNRWLKVKLQGKRNRFGIGATVRVVVQGQPPKSRLVSAGAHYLSQDDAVVHVGVGAATQVDAVEVLWPGGVRQTVAGPHETNRTLEVTEP
ncbi:MAG: CRTAC1 family protein [Myxococcales bacterium]|nr:CRTAC1 family protein [Myxococcales bacterium]